MVSKLIMKALLYRVIATGSTILAALLITKNVKISFAVGLLEFTIKTIVYLSYDILWRHYVDNSTTKKR